MTFFAVNLCLRPNFLSLDGIEEQKRFFCGKSDFLKCALWCLGCFYRSFYVKFFGGKIVWLNFYVISKLLWFHHFPSNISETLTRAKSKPTLKLDQRRLSKEIENYSIPRPDSHKTLLHLKFISFFLLLQFHKDLHFFSCCRYKSFDTKHVFLISWCYYRFVLLLIYYTIRSQYIDAHNNDFEAIRKQRY